MDDQRYPGTGVTPAARTAQPARMTLYGMAEDLRQLIALRDEMIENHEDTMQVDLELQEYFVRLPKKVDDFVHFLSDLKEQKGFAEKEEKRLGARVKWFESWISYLERCAIRAIQGEPEPRKGPRRLMGNTSTLTLAGNGGVEPLDIYDESLVPDELCTYVAELSNEQYRALRRAYPAMESLERAVRYVDTKKVRERMKRPCPACAGRTPGPEPCGACAGMGLEVVPGARMKERGQHLRIT